MSLMHVDFNHIRLPLPSKEAVWPVLEKFLADMDDDRSSFFHLPGNSNWETEWAAIQPELARRIPEIDCFIQLGIGGSSLGSEAIVKALGTTNAPAFHFFENIDPDWINDCLSKVNPKKTLIYLVAKSGNTMETLSQFIYLMNWFEKHMSPEQARNHLVFCTHPDQKKNGAVRELANQWKIPTFTIPPNLGGRFSVLSAVGLFPALVAGVDVKQLLKGAADCREEMLRKIQAGEVPEALALAHQLITHAEKNAMPITVFMPYSHKLRTLSLWFTQLWAESLGKQGKGLTPLSSVGATDQHSILQLLRDGPKDKVIGFVEVQGFQKILEIQWNGPKLGALDMLNGITMNQLMDAELNATRQVMSNQERPHFSLILPKLNAHTLGQIFFFLETLTALAGYMLEIDPFDQPGVEEGKVITQERIIAAKRNMN